MPHSAVISVNYLPRVSVTTLPAPIDVAHNEQCQQTALSAFAKPTETRRGVAAWQWHGTSNGSHIAMCLVRRLSPTYQQKQQQPPPFRKYGWGTKAMLLGCFQTLSQHTHIEKYGDHKDNQDNKSDNDADARKSSWERSI